MASVSDKDDFQSEVAKWNGSELALGLRAAASSTQPPIDSFTIAIMREAAKRLVESEKQVQA